ncbi:MAG: polymer-forming cytoskeletal protein [Anaerolineae bacterium]
MTESTNNPNRRRIFSLRKREQQIRGHHTGHIQSNEPVVIERDAVINGDVSAPQIRVEGLLNGTAVTYDLTVTSSGQIWGDVMAAQLQMEPGSRIQGWISSISPDDPLPDENNVVKVTAMLPELPEELAGVPSSSRSQSQKNLLRHLQNLAGEAQADYATLKAQFDERLTEMAGRAFDKSDVLSHKLDETKLELKKIQKELDKTKTTLTLRESTIQQQEEEIAETKTLIQQQDQELKDLTQSYQTLMQQYEDLQAAKNAGDMSLLESLKEIDTLQEQIRTLETTLQTSIQRTTEQEDALLHWQELAETTQRQIVELEKDKETFNRQLEESALFTGKLREKNHRLEFELQQAFNELDELRERVPDTTTEEMQFALADAHQQIATLNGLLEEAKQAVADAEEQVIWHKANMQTAQRALEESRAIVTQQTDLLEAMRAEKETEERTAAKWKTAVEEMATRLQEKEKDLQARDTQYSEQLTQLETETKQIKEESHRRKMQIETFEAEIETHLKQMDEQGQRLANIQANLVERELEIDQLKQQLKQAQNKIAWQTNFINKMKRVTSETIDSLETRLKQAEQRGQSG